MRRSPIAAILTVLVIFIIITILTIFTPAAAQAQSVPCSDQWVVQTIPTSELAYATASGPPYQQANPPQVMPTGSAAHPFIVATFVCADFVSLPADVEYRIVGNIHEARYYEDKWLGEVYEGRAEAAGSHPFGNGLHMAWVVRAPVPPCGDCDGAHGRR